MTLLIIQLLERPRSTSWPTLKYEPLPKMELNWEGIIQAMEQPPDFLTSPLESTEEEIFKPERVPFRGGIIAWFAAILVAIVVIIFKMRTGEIPCLTIQIFTFFFLAAVLITFSTWVDSKTVIKVTPSHISYRSPFRKFIQNWDQVSEISLAKAGNFWRVWIRGNQSAFAIRVSTELGSKSQLERVLDLPHGDRLVRIICGMAKLSQVENVGGKWLCRRAS
jgi:hypothetical protein